MTAEHGDDPPWAESELWPNGGSGGIVLKNP